VRKYQKYTAWFPIIALFLMLSKLFRLTNNQFVVPLAQSLLGVGLIIDGMVTRESDKNASKTRMIFGVVILGITIIVLADMWR